MSEGSTSVALIPTPKDKTAAERQRRYRQRKRDAPRDGVTPKRDAATFGDGTILPEQAAVTFGFNANGDLTLKQSAWPDEDDVIVVGKGNIDAFLDRLTDVCGVPSFPGHD